MSPEDPGPTSLIDEQIGPLGEVREVVVLRRQVTGDHDGVPGVLDPERDRGSVVAIDGDRRHPKVR